MFGLKVTGATYAFDVDGYRRALQKYVEAKTRLAAVEFAQAALARIPIRTGFVAGAFGALVDLLGPNARFNPIVGFITREFYYGSGGKILKTPFSGRKFATKEPDVFKWEGTTFVFNYEVDITYFAINDVTGGHAPTAPWGAFAAAKAAFEAAMHNFGVDYNVDFGEFIRPILIK